MLTRMRGRSLYQPMKTPSSLCPKVDYNLNSPFIHVQNDSMKERLGCTVRRERAREGEVMDGSLRSFPISLRSIGHVLETEVNRWNEERHDREDRREGKRDDIPAFVSLFLAGHSLPFHLFSSLSCLSVPSNRFKRLG